MINHILSITFSFPKRFERAKSFFSGFEQCICFWLYEYKDQLYFIIFYKEKRKPIFYKPKQQIIFINIVIYKITLMQFRPIEQAFQHIRWQMFSLYLVGNQRRHQRKYELKENTHSRIALLFVTLLSHRIAYISP